MPRDLGDGPNILYINDPVGGDRVGFFYRLPTTSERTAYETEMIERKGRKIITRGFPTRSKYGLRIIEGITDGSFMRNGKAISSNPESPDFDPEWKACVEEKAKDLVAALAVAVFEGARVDTTDNVDIVGAEVEDVAPLEKNSGA
jgi:hypothetical protein